VCLLVIEHILRDAIPLRLTHRKDDLVRDRVIEQLLVETRVGDDGLRFRRVLGRAYRRRRGGGGWTAMARAGSA
jgi:hypothetical protein